MVKGRKPKITEEIAGYIDAGLTAQRARSYEQMAAEVAEKFGISISKATISKRAKRLNLDIKRGRKKMRAEKKKHPAHSLFFDCAGSVFLKGADLESGLLSSVNQIFKPRKATPQAQKVLKLAQKINALLIYAPIFGLESARQIAGYHRRGLKCVSGENVMPSSKDIEQYLQYLKAKKLLPSINKEVTKYCAQVLAIGIDFKGQMAYLDPQNRTVWANTKIPARFSATLNTAIRYINETFWRSSIKNPLILQTAPGYTFLPPEMFSLMRCLDRSKIEPIGRIAILDEEGKEHASWSNIKMPKKGYFIFPLTPWQYERMGHPKITHEYKLYHIGPRKEPIEVADAQIALTDTQLSETINLRAALVKRKDENICLVTNILYHDERYIRKIADAFFYRWPGEKTRTFYDIMEEAHEEMEKRGNKKLDLTTLLAKNVQAQQPQAFQSYLEYLNWYAKRRYFPSEFEGKSLAYMSETIYRQGGYLRTKKDAWEIFLSPFDDEGVQKACKFACDYFNKCGLMLHTGKYIRIYLMDKK